LLGNGAYMFLASGFLMTDMLTLRAALVGGYTGLVAFHAMHRNPLKIPLGWSFVFVLVNAGAAGTLLYDQYCPLSNEEEEEVYGTHFATTLTRGQFRQLMRMATKHEIPDNVILTLEGRPCPNLYFVLKGKAKVYHQRTFAASIDQGGFVNDIAFQQQQQQRQTQNQKQFSTKTAITTTAKEDDETSVNVGDDDSFVGNKAVAVAGAYGTVVTDGDCSVVKWNQAELRDYLRRRPEMERNFQYTLSRQLMKSLLKQREARRQHMKRLTDREWKEEMDGAEAFWGNRRVTHKYGAPTYVHADDIDDSNNRRGKRRTSWWR